MEYFDHDQAVKALFKDKSLDALWFLIEQGRELEFTYTGFHFFLSRSNSSQYVSIWQADTEQSFESIESLLHHAVLNHDAFVEAWANVKLDFLF